MSIVLRKDPILEAVCEFAFSSPDWDWTVPGLVYKKIKDRFPEKTEGRDINFSIEQRADGVHPAASQTLGRMQFWSEGRKSLVQIGMNHLSVHSIRSYEGWPIFKDLIESVLRDYESEAPTSPVRAMSLRYINQMPFPPVPTKIEHLLKTVPQIPNSDDQQWLSWFQQVEISRPEKAAVLGVRSGYLPTMAQTVPVQDAGATLVAEPPTIMLDLLFSHAGAKTIERSNVSSWLEMAHGEIEDMFFASVHSEYLKTFEPEVENVDAS